MFEAAPQWSIRPKQAAAAMLEADPADIVLTSTPARSRGRYSRNVARLAQIAPTAPSPTVAVCKPSGFSAAGATAPFGVQLSVVEVDRDTGQVTPVRHVTCDDAGVIVNPMIVEGQVHGGVASGITHALGEVFVYDDDGNPLTGNFMDYAIASAAELPSFERIPLETPTVAPLGAKGNRRSARSAHDRQYAQTVVDALAPRHPACRAPCTPEQRVATPAARVTARAGIGRDRRSDRPLVSSGWPDGHDARPPTAAQGEVAAVGADRTGATRSDRWLTAETEAQRE